MKPAYEALKTSVFVTVVALWVTGILHDFIERYLPDPFFWKQAVLMFGMMMILATVCAIAMERKNDANR